MNNKLILLYPFKTKILIPLLPYLLNNIFILCPYLLKIFPSLIHNNRINSCIYACKTEDEPISCKVYPMILSRIHPNFSFSDSTFGIDKYKETTARALVFRGLSISSVFTLEISFFGFQNKGSSIKEHFLPENLFTLGADLMKSL